MPPHAYFVVSAVFHYLGPAFAVLLFARVDVLGVAWLRIASAAVIFAAWRRPWRLWRRLDRPTRRLLAAWAAVLAVMNSCFYLALDRLPLGTVAAIEFLPVIVLAALAARTLRNSLALCCAVAGVYLLTDVRLVAEPLGVAFAVANAALFALYIVLGHRVARHDRMQGIDGLAIAMHHGRRRRPARSASRALPRRSPTRLRSRRRRRRHLLIGHPLRHRPARHGPPARAPPTR